MLSSGAGLEGSLTRVCCGGGGWDGGAPDLDVCGVGGAGEVGVYLLEVALGVPAPREGLETPTWQLVRWLRFIWLSTERPKPAWGARYSIKQFKGNHPCLFRDSNFS